ncbi:MAG: hypothetical protein QOE45_1865 [Frankiaceae bacterium]|jgi:hypothetical protein|nr:hypothetical protein [Frankiaceae bacterium]
MTRAQYLLWGTAVSGSVFRGEGSDRGWGHLLAVCVLFTSLSGLLAVQLGQHGRRGRLQAVVLGVVAGGVQLAWSANKFDPTVVAVGGAVVTVVVASVLNARLTRTLAATGHSARGPSRSVQPTRPP